jgi:hypothetical protein
MLTSHELLGFMSPGLATEILNSIYETDKPFYRTVMASAAEARKLRPIFLERQPRPQRHAMMISTLSRPSLDLMAGNLLRAWLLKKYKAICIEHKEGVVEDLPATMDDEKLKAAVETLLSKYPPEVVAVYLHAFNEMNQVNWTNLKTMLEADKRLQLGSG